MLLLVKTHLVIIHMSRGTEHAYISPVHAVTKSLLLVLPEAIEYGVRQLHRDLQELVLKH